MERRIPLSDITKSFNLTPTSDLREIVAGTSKSFSKPPISISKSNSCSTNRNFFSASSSKSNTSIGSSNVGAPLNSKKTVQFRSPSPSISSITTPGKKREIGKGITGNSPGSVKKINAGKEGILKYSRTSTVKNKDTGLECLNRSGFFVERGKDKGKPLSTFNSSHEKTKEKGKAILQPADIVETTQSAKDKSKPANTFNPSYETTKEKGKQKLQHSDIVEVAEHRASFDGVAGKSQPSRRKIEKRKIDFGASSCPPMTRLKSIQNELDEDGDKSSKSWNIPRPKHRKRIEKTCELPKDFIEQKKAYFKEIDDFELVEEEATPDELD